MIKLAALFFFGLALYRFLRNLDDFSTQKKLRLIIKFCNSIKPNLILIQRQMLSLTIS